MKKPSDTQLQVPIMFAFREAFEEGDSRKRVEQRVDGERVLSHRGSLRRRGAQEAVIKANLSSDLLSLVNTIDLASSVDLEGMDAVRKSVLNFGLCDIAHLVSEDEGVESIGEDLKTALLLHEPRLRRDSLVVEREEIFDAVAQKMRFNISAEMVCKPLDVPLEFIAEVDIGSGKVQISKLPGT